MKVGCCVKCGFDDGFQDGMQVFGFVYVECVGCVFGYVGDLGDFYLQGVYIVFWLIVMMGDLVVFEMVIGYCFVGIGCCYGGFGSVLDFWCIGLVGICVQIEIG